MTCRQNRFGTSMMWVLLILMTLMTLLPLSLMVLNSFKTRMEITTNPLSWPKVPQFANYKNAWVQGEVFHATVNSLVLVVGTLVITIVSSCMAAYALSRKQMRFTNGLSVYFLVCNTIPKQLFIIPLFFMLQKLGLIDNLVPMMFVYSAIFSPFAIFLLHTYFIGISKDIINSAVIDGASSWQVFWKIVLPLVQPGILTVALIVGLWCWNEFLFAVTFLQSDSVTTLAVKFYGFTSRYVTEWGSMMAFAVMVSVPVIMFFVFLQNRFIDGMTAGGVKG
ncbi:carbohydrate ABC transporter permease [uncultured Sphaerochaeta sp.]|uniref:carbohydrate ABC transporter permease n=1 Tax=uncultured Sphaerochaeta sp. TaxID=886478 RepID=UPI002A0A5C01|nr:carbohydrate ABC transporter permease [uncultured Sphaerochaeta sp.]